MVKKGEAVESHVDLHKVGDPLKWKAMTNSTDMLLDNSESPLNLWTCSWALARLTQGA